jgi:uncharacterized protein (TIRG00374 family)
MGVKKSQGGNWRRLIPGLVVSVICLLVVFWNVNFQELIDVLHAANYLLVGIGISLTVVWLLVRSFAWRSLLLDQPTFSQTFFTLSEGYLLNNLLPFRLGEIARVFLMSEKADLPFWLVFSSIVIERMLDLTIAVSLLLISLLFVVRVPWAVEAATGVAFAVLIGFFVLYLLALNRSKFIDWIEKITRRWEIVYRFVSNPLRAFLDGLLIITQPWRFLRVIGWMLLNWLVGITQYYLFIRAFNVHADLLMATFTLGVTSLGIAAPSLPGALGILELAIRSSLSVFGIQQAVALAVAEGLRLSGYVVTGILGAVGLARDGETMTGLYNRARAFTRTLRSRDAN